MANHVLLYLSALQLLPLQMALNTTIIDMPDAKGFGQQVDQVVPNGLESGQDIEEDESLINLSVIVTNMAPGSMFTHLEFYLSNLLKHLTQESRLRLLIITDAKLVNLLTLHLKM